MVGVGVAVFVGIFVSVGDGVAVGRVVVVAVCVAVATITLCASGLDVAVSVGSLVFTTSATSLSLCKSSSAPFAAESSGVSPEFVGSLRFSRMSETVKAVASCSGGGEPVAIGVGEPPPASALSRALVLVNAGVGDAVFVGRAVGLGRLVGVDANVGVDVLVGTGVTVGVGVGGVVCVAVGSSVTAFATALVFPTSGGGPSCSATGAVPSVSEVAATTSEAGVTTRRP